MKQFLTLEETFLHLVDCQIAHYEWFIQHKAVSKVERYRHYLLAKEAIEACEKFQLNPLSIGQLKIRLLAAYKLARICGDKYE